MSGGSGEFAILENPVTCSSWSATSDSSWLTVASAAQSDSTTNYNGVISYNVAPFSASGVRTGHINVPGAGAFTVVQLGVPSPCDVNLDGQTNVLDVQLMINEGLGSAQPLNDLNNDRVVNVVDIQIAIDAVLKLGCSASSAGG
jgi:hypothetical protein